MRYKSFYIFLLITILLWMFTPINVSAKRGIKVKIKASEKRNAPVAGEVTLYGESHALVIGIDNYTQGWPRLSGAVNDATLVAAELRQKGFDVTFKKNLDSRTLKQTFEEFFILKGNHPQTRLFIWFAGHGHTLNGEGFLIPTDAPLPHKGAEFRLKALSMRRFGEFVRLAQSKHALAVFDSCFSGTIFDTQRSAPPPAITRATTLPVRQFLTSGDTDQKVSDDGRFRKLFIRAIRGEERADANQDGYVTGSELGLFLTDRVTNLTESRQTPRYGKLRDEDYDRGDFVFLLASSGAVIEEPAPVSSKVYLSVESNVSAARVMVDDRYVGTTNLSDVEITSGEHRIRVEKDGYEPYTRKVRFEKGRIRDLFVVLDPKAPLKGRIYVETQPDNARVRILNIGTKFIQGMALDAGRYHVEVSADSYETQKIWITLGSDEDKSIDVMLNKRVIPPSSYSSHGIVEDSYLKIATLNIKKSGNKTVNIQLKYQNKTDKEIRIEYAGPHAFLSDNLGNESTGWGTIPGFNLPPNGSKSVGLRFEFDSYKVKKLGGQLGNEFSLTIKHTSSPPGQVSFMDLRTKK